MYRLFRKLVEIVKLVVQIEEQNICAQEQRSIHLAKEIMASSFNMEYQGSSFTISIAPINNVG